MSSLPKGRTAPATGENPGAGHRPRSLPRGPRVPLPLRGEALPAVSGPRVPKEEPRRTRGGVKGCLDAGCRGPVGSNPGVAGCRPRGRTGRSGQGGTCRRRLPSRPPVPTPGAGGPGLCLGGSGGRRAPSQPRTRQAGPPELAARRTRPRGVAGATHPRTGRGSRPRDWQREPGAAGWAPRSAGWRQSPRGARSTQPPRRYFLYFPPATAGPAPGPPTGKAPRAVREPRRWSSAGRRAVRQIR